MACTAEADERYVYLALITNSVSKPMKEHNRDLKLSVISMNKTWRDTGWLCGNEKM